MKHRLMKLAYLAQCGHVGSCLSCLDILDAVYRIKKPNDIVILSKGHAALALYVVLEKYGFLPSEVLETYGKEGSVLLGHPERMPEYGIMATTGSLGHGLPIGLGMALADKNRRVYVIMGDGELQEGSVWEGAALAAALGVNNLTVVVDGNGFQGIDKTTSARVTMMALMNGWWLRGVDGHDVERLSRSLLDASYEGPSALYATTVKGKGWKRFEGTNDSHYARVLEGDL